MKTRNYYSFIIIVLALFITTSRAAIIIWTNSASGNWSDTNNWSPNQIPGASDVAVITNDATYAVTLDQNGTVSGLLLGTSSGSANVQTFQVGSGNTLAVNGTASISTNGSLTFGNNQFLGGNMSLNGALTLSGGTVNGALTILNGSTVTIASGVTLNSATLTNYGTVIWGNGTISANFNPQIFNYGLWNVQSNNNLTCLNGGSTFNNFGTFLKSAGGGTTTLDAQTSFNTSGTLDVESGTVSFTGGTGSGTVTVASGSTISIDSRFYFNGSVLGSGSGTVGGFLIGSNATFSGTVNFSGGILAGTLTLTTNSTLNISGAVTFDNNYGSPAIFTNNGTVNWSGGDFNCNGSPTVDNYDVWNAQSDNTFNGQHSSGSATFNNFGTLRKSAGVNATTINSTTAFNNRGTVDAESGTIYIQTGIGSGIFNAANSTFIDFDDNFVLVGNNTFSGSGGIGNFLVGSNGIISGTLNWAGGTAMSGSLTIASNAVLNLPQPIVFNSVYAGTAILTNYGTVNWSTNISGDSSPQIENYGFWIAQADNITFAGEQHFGHTTFDNFGTFRKSAATGTTVVDASTIFNNYGTLDALNGTMTIQSGLSANGTHNIAGGATLSVPSGFVFYGNAAFSGSGNLADHLVSSNAIVSGTVNCAGTTLSGALTLATNSVLNLSSNATFNGSPLAAIFTNYGTVNWTAGTLFGDGGPVIANYGTWNAQNDGSFHGQNSSGTTTFNNFGTFRKATTGGTTAMTFFVAFINYGLLDVQTGTVFTTVATIGGTMNFGINSSNNFGKVAFPSSAVLGGTVSLNLNNSFAPVLSNSFPVITYDSRTGSFTNLLLPALANSLVWTNNYATTSFSLKVVSVAAPVIASQIAIGGGAASLTFGAVTGQTYQVQFTTNLLPANWINLGDPITATNTTINVSDTNGYPQNFYRVFVP